MGSTAVGREAEDWFRTHWNTSMSIGEWWRLLAESGWGQPRWPVGRFGRGLEGGDAVSVIDARRRVGALGGPVGIATMLTGPTLLAHGTPEQLDRFLPGVVTGEHVWCQLFSEPSAGSDLASLRTRAERDGDHWIVNGQKVWTSGANVADYGLLIARTDPSVPKHRGITYFLIDMHQPGVEVRPLRDITGRAHFNEVFLTDAVVPAESVVSDVNDGWRVTLTTLAAERSSIGGKTKGGGAKLVIPAPDLTAPVHEVLREAQLAADAEAAQLRGTALLRELARQRGVGADPLVRDAIAQSTIDHDVGRWLSQRGSVAPSVLKLATARNLHALGRAAFDVSGPYGTLAGPDALADNRALEVVATGFTMSIGGGTDQIQRNIIGERILGLPGEPRTDKDVPFGELPR